MATTSSITNLDSYYQSLINYTMTQAKVPVTNLTKKKDDVTVKKAVYQDLKVRFDALSTSLKALWSSQTTYAMTAGRSVAVNPETSGTTVATALVGNSVSAGTYALSVTKLATAHEVRSTKQTYSDQALGLTGTFVIGGAASRSAAINGAGLPDTISSVLSNDTVSIATGQKEMGTGTYYIETREDATEGWQFRIVDAEGNALNIQNTEDSSFTTSWQNIPVGTTFDTGRGLKVTFGGDSGLYTAAYKDTGAVQVDYVAKGASIDVTAGMSLVDINSAINSAAFAAGNEVTSTIIDKTLVLRNQYSGASHVMAGSDSTGSVLSTLGVIAAGVLNTKVTPINAEFSINGMNMIRSSNTGLTDVVAGMTLDLASDAEGKNANIVVTGSTTGASNTINTFISKFNDLTSYLRSKTTTVKNADNTYTRGALVGEQNLRYVANDLVNIMGQDQTNTGIYQNMSEIGITVNSDLSLTVSDATLLSTALTNNLADVTKLMDVAMSSMSNMVDTYTATSGYLSQSITSADSSINNYQSRIDSMNERLNKRQDSLVKHYAQVQAQMETLMQTYNLNNTLYG